MSDQVHRGVHSGICSGCGAAQVYERIKPDDEFLHMTNWSLARVSIVVCAACGKIEHYVREPKDRQKIVEKWAHVTPTGGVKR